MGVCLETQSSRSGCVFRDTIVTQWVCVYKHNCHAVGVCLETQSSHSVCLCFRSCTSSSTRSRMWSCRRATLSTSAVAPTPHLLGRPRLSSVTGSCLCHVSTTAYLLPVSLSQTPVPNTLPTTLVPRQIGCQVFVDLFILYFFSYFLYLWNY